MRQYRKSAEHACAEPAQALHPALHDDLESKFPTMLYGYSSVLRAKKADGTIITLENPNMQQPC